MKRVSCTSSTECLAVGYSATPQNIEHTLAEVRHGAAWSIRTTPNPVGAIASSLSGVSCVSSTSCVAVGSSTNGSDVQRALIEAWNGIRWEIRRSPLIRGAGWSELNQVSCTSAGACTAVGSYITHGIQQTLVDSWNGRTWSVRGSPNPRGASYSTLQSVSCVSSKVCTAVGYYGSHASDVFPLAEAWDGLKWSIRAAPHPVGSASRQWSELTEVSCTASTACMAVGDYALSNAEPFVALAEWWNGKAWRIRQPPAPIGSSGSPLTGVSCISPSSCTAVGFATRGTRETTLAEVWNGTAWHIEATPNPARDALSDLAGVSCRLETACTAAGFAGTGGLDEPLAETNHP